MKIKEIIKNIPYISFVGDDEISLDAITEDSRKVNNKTAFCAIKGFTVDGHHFIEEAIEKGSPCIIHEKPVEQREKVAYLHVKDGRKTLGEFAASLYGNPSRHFQLIGITGTNGKTTISYMLKEIIAKGAVIGTNGVLFQDQKIPLAHTTPSGDELQKIFKKLLNQGASTVIMEVSSHALALDRVEGSDFDWGIFTNLTMEHMDFHKTMENYYEAKKKLFYRAKTGGVINIDDPYGRRLYQELQGRENYKMISYGFSKDADICALHYKIQGNKMDALLSICGHEKKFNFPIMTKYNLYNMMAAMGYCLGTNQWSLTKNLKNFSGAAGRFEQVDNTLGLHLIIDFAHTPDALENLLSSIETNGKILLVFGVAGDRTREIKEKMGEVASKYADEIIITTDDPKKAKFQDIVKDIKRGFSKDTKYHIIENRKDAIAKSLSLAKEDDFIIFAGKSEERIMKYDGYEKPYHEKETIKKELEKLNGLK
ncbi:MAG: UDP-N-acetylmuramoyl-L-alanyl-D-glutamate--2,6-diaminopimelate ligase [Tissierellia bacterium]|nr:UDP-N-acetylmuramoyl-L-alanyl-D-glutamate--2,6-diaminopimelate ligase [Tissierellia bacterium]